MAKTIHTDKAPAAIGPYVQGENRRQSSLCKRTSSLVT